jgi:hypothetical protein
MHLFRIAIEARNIAAAVELLADDVEFRSPAVFTPYRGRAAAAALLNAVSCVFEDFQYVREIGEPDGRDHALVFEARIGDTHIEGCDFLRTDRNGAIDELVVMVRPLSGAHALTDAMRRQLGSAPSHDAL